MTYQNTHRNKQERDRREKGIKQWVPNASILPEGKLMSMMKKIMRDLD